MKGNPMQFKTNEHLKLTRVSFSLTQHSFPTSLPLFLAFLISRGIKRFFFFLILCLLLSSCIILNLVTPGEPLVRVNGRSLESLGEGKDSSETATSSSSSTSSFPEVTRVGPVDEGSLVSLECSSLGGRPLPDIKWFDRSHQIKSKISVSETPDTGSTVTSSAKIIITRKDLDSTFTCSVSNNATTMPFLRSISFDVRGELL